MALAAIEALLGSVIVWWAAALVVEFQVLSAWPFWPAYLTYGVVVALCLASMGLYNPHLRSSWVGIAIRLLLAALLTFGVVLGWAWLVPGIAVQPGRLAIAAVISAAFGALLRLLGQRLLGEDLFKRRVLVYGAGRQARNVAALRRRTDRIGFRVVGYVPTESDTSSAADLPRLDQDQDQDLRSLCKAHAVHEIVVAMDDRRRSFPLHDLLQCRLAGIDVTEIVAFLERETGRVRLDVLNPGWIIFGPGFPRGSLRRHAYRAFDLVVSTGLLIFLSPVFLLVAAAIKLDGGVTAPVVYRQRRVGRDGRVFDLLKFRSMHPADESAGDSAWHHDHSARVTRVGRFIRRTALDELPQVVNVLRGDMRLVGPRPERPAVVGRLAQKIPYYSERHSVAPGVTGWGQLCYPYGSSDEDAAERLQYDLYYVKNRSLMFDIAILIQTVEIMLFSRGRL